MMQNEPNLATIRETVEPEPQQLSPVIMKYQQRMRDDGIFLRDAPSTDSDSSSF